MSQKHGTRSIPVLVSWEGGEEVVLELILHAAEQVLCDPVGTLNVASAQKLVLHA